MSNLTKTIKLQLYPTIEQKIQLDKMSEQYRQACNYVSEWIFNNDLCLKTAIINEKLYYFVRDKFNLKAQMTQSVFKTVVARYKTVKEQYKQNPYKYKDQKGKTKFIKRTLEWLRKPIFFNRPQVDLVMNRDYSFRDNFKNISLNTLEDRLVCPFEHKHFGSYINNKDFKLGTGKIVSVKGKYYFHIPVTFEVKDFEKSNVRHIVGIDRGLRFLISTYDEKDKCSFVSGKEIMNKRNHFAYLRKQLQSKGTKSARRALKRLNRRENRYMANVNHKIAKTLCDKYGSDTLFVIEDLIGVSFEESNLNTSKKQKHNLRTWSFYQLEQFLIYKSNQIGSEVLKVNPDYTSQRCPKCGTIRKENRNHKYHEYICSNCGYHSNDDRIGAMNLYKLGTDYISGVEKPKFEIQKIKQLY